jgi:hypothetical protein
MKLSEKLRNTRFLLAASLIINLFLLASWLGSVEYMRSSYESEYDELHNRAINAEISGQNALVKVKESGEKIYELQRSLVSERSAMKDLKERYQEDAKKYKRIIGHLSVQLEAKVDSVFIEAEPSESFNDSMMVILPQNVSYKDDKWMSFTGKIKRKDGKLGLMIEEMTMRSGKISVDDVEKKQKWYKLSRPQPVVRINVESPYFTMMSAQEYKVNYKPKRNIGLKIITHAAAFAAGVYLAK